MTPLQKIRSSFTSQLTLWVAGFVLMTAGAVIVILGSYSQDVIHDETMDATRQALENMALRTDNRLRHVEMTARLEGHELTVDRGMIERQLDESGYLTTLRLSLPNATLAVVQDKAPDCADDEYCLVQPIGDRAFSLVVTCPKSDITGKYGRMQRLLLVWGVIGVVALLTLLRLVMDRHLRPLHLLADAAQGIADGNLETPIPDAHHAHEAGRLQSSLQKMQASLRSYIDEMQQKQTALSARNAELQSAYDEAQEYERMKAAFLTDMTAQMTAPVEDVSVCTNDICRHYASMTNAEMEQRQTTIMEATETITRLLDTLMHNNQNNTGL